MEPWRKDLYLSHHGILGQRCGVQNGPPYPLDSGSHSSSEEKAGWRKSLDSTHNLKGEKKEGLETLAIMYAPEIALCAYSIGHEVAVRSTIHREEKARKKAPKDKTGLPLKTKERSDKEDVKAVNRAYHMAWGDGNIGATKNCMHCSIAYEMRRRGYDVVATKSASGRYDEYLKTIFPNCKIKGSTTKESLKNNPNADENAVLALRGKNREVANKAISDLKKEPANSRGVLLLTWGGGGGHACNYQIDANGSVSIFDAQPGRVLNEKQAAKEYLARCTMVSYVRTDNVKVDNKEVKRSVKGW